jgi:hypothetical protein
VSDGGVSQKFTYLETGCSTETQVALAAVGVGKGRAKIPEEEVRKIEVAYPRAFCRAARAAGARVCGL